MSEDKEKTKKTLHSPDCSCSENLESSFADEEKSNTKSSAEGSELKLPEGRSNEESTTEGTSTNLIHIPGQGGEENPQYADSESGDSYDDHFSIVECYSDRENSPTPHTAEESNVEEIDVEKSSTKGDEEGRTLNDFVNSAAENVNETNLQSSNLTETAESKLTNRADNGEETPSASISSQQKTDEKIPSSSSSQQIENEPAAGPSQGDSAQSVVSSQKATQAEKQKEETPPPYQHISDEELIRIAALAGQDVCGRASPIFDNINEAQPRVRAVKYSHQDSYESRVQTFTNWPRSMKQTPEQLAAAGFFSRGLGDETICFHCGLALGYWEDDDDPWEQHALWYPKCPFLLSQKGAEFVDRVQDSFAGAVTRSLNRDTTIIPNHLTLSHIIASLDPASSVPSTQLPGNSASSESPKKPTHESKITPQLRVVNLSNTNVQTSSTNSLQETSVAPSQSNLLKSYSQQATASSSSPAGRDVPPSRTESLESGYTNHPGSSRSNVPEHSEAELQEPLQIEVRNISQALGDMLQETVPTIDVPGLLPESAVEPGETAGLGVGDISQEAVSKLGQPLQFSYMTLPAPKSLEEGEEASTSSANNMLQARANSTKEKGKSVRQSSTSEVASCSRSASERFSSESEQFRVDRRCKICQINEMRIVFLPCGHVVSCEPCALVTRICIMCGKKVEARYRAFIA